MASVVTIFLYGIAALVGLALLIYVVVRRMDDRNKEDFENRES